MPNQSFPRPANIQYNNASKPLPSPSGAQYGGSQPSQIGAQYGGQQQQPMGGQYGANQHGGGGMHFGAQGVQQTNNQFAPNQQMYTMQQKQAFLQQQQFLKQQVTAVHSFNSPSPLIKNRY